MDFALNCLAVLLLLTLPCTFFLKNEKPKINQWLNDKVDILGMIKLAFQTPSYNFLALGFFTCGFHVAFISTHLPGVIAYCGLPTSLSGWSLAFIGFLIFWVVYLPGGIFLQEVKAIFIINLFF